MDSYLIYVLAGLGLLLVVSLLRWALNDPGKTAPADVEAVLEPAVEDEEEPPEPIVVPDAAALIEVLRSGEPGPCRDAVKALADLGVGALPALEAALAEDDPDLQFDVRRAMRLINDELPE